MVHEPITVQKYGGAVLASAEKIRAVARTIVERSQKGEKIVAVVSAMGATTNELLRLASEVVTAEPKPRELDMLLSTGERISASLLALAINDLGGQAVSFTGSQAGVLTDESHFQARIQAIHAPRVEQALTQKQVVVLAGYQGVSPVSKDITTLGRGGTDVSAVAMAIHLKARRCEILKDVAGVHSADPSQVPAAQLLKKVSYPELQAMSFWGAKMLHHRAADLAAQYELPLLIGSFAESNSESNWGTHVVNKEEPMEKTKITSIQTLNSVEVFDLRKSSLEEILKDFHRHDLPEPQILQISASHVLFKTETGSGPKPSLRGCMVTLIGHHLESGNFLHNLLSLIPKNPDMSFVQVEPFRVSFFVNSANVQSLVQTLHKEFVET